MKARLLSLATMFAGYFGFEFIKQSSLEELKGVLKNLLPNFAGHELIRIGKSNDGGYLLPNDLVGITKCISPGCDKNISFENQLLSEHGITSVIIDKVEARPNELDSRMEYIEKWVGTYNSVDLISISKLVKTYPDGDLLLQMDIEGAEYGVLQSISDEDLNRFRIIVIEFHYLSLLKNKTFINYVAKEVFEKLWRSHVPVHFHPNNCTSSWSHLGIDFPEVLEMTYLRRDRISSDLKPAEIPHVLDTPNVPGNPEPVITLFPIQ